MKHSKLVMTYTSLSLMTEDAAEDALYSSSVNVLIVTQP